jgi:hypothetical protein
MKDETTILELELCEAIKSGGTVDKGFFYARTSW